MPRNKNLDELKEILKKFSLEEALYLEKQDKDNASFEDYFQHFLDLLSAIKHLRGDR